MTFLELLARFDPKTKRTQLLRVHTDQVATLCAISCAKIGLRALGRLTGLLHDSGKAGEAFQVYIREDNPAARGSVNHSACGARYVYERFFEGKGELEQLTAEWIIAAVCGHHSGLPDCTNPRGEDRLHLRAYPERETDYEQAIGRFLEACAAPDVLADLFRQAAEEVGQLYARICAFCDGLPEHSRDEQCCLMLGLVQRYLMSALIDADRYDAYCFEAGIAPEPEREDPALWEKLSARLEVHLDKLAQKAPENEKADAINQKRREIADACSAFAGHTTGVFRLVVPTGGGKTYSSMRYALRCAAQAQAGKQRIFYVAPYKTILEQNAGDIREVLKQDDAVLEHHGDVSFEGENDEASREALQHWELLTERWDAPVILTTTVQFLNTLFDGSSKCVRRMHRLADAVIILDEVQAMPVRCLHLFNAAMNFLACVLGCAVVLCTATQPELGEVRHPILLSKPCDMVPDPEAMSAAFHRVEVKDRPAEPEMDAQTLAEFVHERAQEEGSTLAVLNTKATAAGLFAALNARMAELPEEERIPLRFLSTSLCPAHRKVVVEDIRTRLKRGERLICVSTQLIEAGVNLSFACVVRALAGLDSIAQAAGRCNRHGEADLRTVYIVRCAGESLGHLKDIRAGQEAAVKVLESFRRAPQLYENDLLSPAAIRAYFQLYFSARKDDMDYKVELTTPATLFDLLGMNRHAWSVCDELGRAMPPHPMHQAFETAGGLFHAIDRQGATVLVPYGEGEKLIADLCGSPSLPAQRALLRKAQRYSVQLFDWEQQRLAEQGALRVLGGSVLALAEGHYNEALGLRLDKQEMQPYIC